MADREEYTQLLRELLPLYGPDKSMQLIQLADRLVDRGQFDELREAIQEIVRQNSGI